MTITEKIIALRTEKRIKSSEIANALDLHHSNYLRIEKRDKELSINQLESIAKVLGVSLMELLNYGEGVESVKVDSEKVKELENKVLLFEKDLEIRDLKLATIEKTKNDLLYDISISYIEYMQLIYFIDIFSIGEKEKIEKELNIQFTKSFFTNNMINIDSCQVISYFGDTNYDDIMIETRIEDFDVFFSKKEVKKYCSFFYDNFKMVLDFEKNLETINTYKISDDIPMNFGSLNWKVVRRTNNDKYFFEVKSYTNKETK